MLSFNCVFIFFYLLKNIDAIAIGANYFALCLYVVVTFKFLELFHRNAQFWCLKIIIEHYDETDDWFSNIVFRY